MSTVNNMQIQDDEGNVFHPETSIEQIVGENGTQVFPGGKPGNMESSDMTTAFTESKMRENIKSGEKHRVLFGKIQKFFTDLKTVAFSGKYGDLSERPTIGGAAGYKVADNDTTNSSEFLSTARVAYEHGQEIDALSSELGTGGDEMSLKSMVSALYGKLANFDLVVDISKYFTTNTNQVFEVASSIDLSGYEYVVICATFQKGKSGNFAEISGCEILDQLGWSHTTSSDEVAIHLVVLKNITGAISILGRYAGTGSATVKAFGFK